MTQEAFHEYMKIVVDMEKAIYIMDTTRFHLRREIGQLGKAKTFCPPLKPALQKPMEIEEEKRRAGKELVSGIMCVVLTMIFYMIDPLEVDIELIAWLLMPLRLVFMFLCAAYAVISLYSGVKHMLEEKKAHAVYEQKKRQAEQQCKRMNDTYIEKYNRELQLYNNAVAEDARRVEREKQRIVLLQREVDKLSAQITKTQANLSKIYSNNVIFPKYRNLIAMCSISEYFDSGRCNRLDGPDGAYNLFELEIRMDRVITQLSEVIKNLERIQQNQYALYNEIRTANRQITYLCRSTDAVVDKLTGMNAKYSEMNNRLENLQNTAASIEQHSAVTAYAAERANVELGYMNRMNYFAGNYDSAHYHAVPPPRK